MPELARAAWSRRLLLALLLAPALLWLVAPDRAAAPRPGAAVVPRARRAASVRAEPRAVPHLLHRAAVLAHLRAHRAHVRAAPPRCTLLVAFPIAWTIAKLARGRMSALLFVVCLIPFWVSETVRTLGWMILLRESGVLPQLLVHLGITAQPVELLYHDATILVGLVYTSLLFMVVPLVGSLESLDNALIEAAYDLGGKGGVDPARDRHPARRAGHHRRLHRGVHADARQLPDAHAARRQELAVVHRADLQPVHHALQLGAGRGASASCCSRCRPPWCGSGSR